MPDRRLELRDLTRTLVGVLPEVQNPSGEIPIRQKAAYTVASLVIFLVGSNLPLYGVRHSSAPDPLYWMHTASASNCDSIMAAGIYTLVLSEALLHFLLRVKIIKVGDGTPEDQMLLNGVQKLFGILIAAALPVSSVLVSTIAGKHSTGQAILVVLQLFSGGVVVIYLDELLRKGYGFLSSIPLFTAINICKNIFWKAFSPFIIKLYGGQCGDQYEERVAISSHIHRLIANGADELSVVHKAFSSRDLPDMASVLATCIFFLLVLNLQGFHIVLPLRSHEEPRLQINYTIRLSYLSFAPLLFQDALVLILYLIPQLLYMKFGETKVVNLLGKWKESKYFRQAVPVSGFAYYLTTPPTLVEFGRHPFHALVYAFWLLLGCAFASMAFFEVLAYSERYVARLLGERRSVMMAQPDSVPQRRWRRYIATAAFLVGLCVGALTLLAGLAGVVGSASGIMLVVTVLYSCFEEIRGRPAGAFGL